MTRMHLAKLPYLSRCGLESSGPAVIVRTFQGKVKSEFSSRQRPKYPKCLTAKLVRLRHKATHIYGPKMRHVSFVPKVCSIYSKYYYFCYIIHFVILYYCTYYIITLLVHLLRQRYLQGREKGRSNVQNSMHYNSNNKGTKDFFFKALTRWCLQKPEKVVDVVCLISHKECHDLL